MYTDSEYGGNSGGRCKISPVHFASDSVSLFGRQSRSAFPATQFGSFVEVSSWLVGVANGTDSQPVNIDVDSDPPATIVRQLLRFAQECGVSATTLAEVTPTSLQQGHGEKVCVFLNLLCDAAIHRLDYKWKPFEYPPDDVACPPNMTTDDDEDDIIEEYLGDGEDYTAAQSPDFEVSGTAAGNLHMSMIIGMADSYKWQEETERVAASLKSKMNSIGKGSSWVTHVGMLREYGAKILGPSLVTTEKNSSAASMDISSANMLDMISSLQHSLLADLSGIARVEKMINTNPDLCRMGMSYANIKQELDSLEERSSSGSKKTIAGSEKLAEIQDTLNELTDQLEAKTGDGGDGDGSSAAVKLKRAIKSIKEEVREMSLRTAMLQTEILAVKKMDINMKRKSASRKQKARSRRNRKVKASTPLEDEYSV
ncbi:ift57 [Symbiodinium microadriaticum]|nr:ift57 [Symbiodinium microadriaticum]